jgi:Ankyrin repeat
MTVDLYEYCYLDTVRLMVRVPNLEINIRDHSGETPLHVACGNYANTWDLSSIVQELLEHSDIDVNVRDKCNETSFHKIIDPRYRITRDSKRKMELLFNIASTSVNLRPAEIYHMMETIPKKMDELKKVTDEEYEWFDACMDIKNLLAKHIHVFCSML